MSSKPGLFVKLKNNIDISKPKEFSSINSTEEEREQGQKQDSGRKKDFERVQFHLSSGVF